MPRSVIALDGPAGVGKTTVGTALAERLGWLFVDTGLFYRVLTLLAQRRGIDPEAEGALVELARRLCLELRPADGEGGRSAAIFVDGEPLGQALRSPVVERAVSRVAALPAVREALVAPQRAAVGEQPAVVAGRDIGTVIFPDAGLKVYLDATAEERARRREAQLDSQGQPADLAEVLGDLRRRDQLDSTRAAAPLTVASDAVPLATDGLSIEQVLSTILDLWQQRTVGRA